MRSSSCTKALPTFEEAVLPVTHHPIRGIFMYTLSSSLSMFDSLKLRQQFTLGFVTFGSLLLATVLMLSPLGDVGDAWVTTMCIFMVFHWLGFLLAFSRGRRWKRSFVRLHWQLPCVGYPATGRVIRWLGTIALLVAFLPLITAALYNAVMGRGINDGTVVAVSVIALTLTLTMSVAVIAGAFEGWNSIEPLGNEAECAPLPSSATAFSKH
jgi:hypothetical protein